MRDREGLLRRDWKGRRQTHPEARMPGLDDDQLGKYIFASNDFKLQVTSEDSALFCALSLEIPFIGSEMHAS